MTLLRDPKPVRARGRLREAWNRLFGPQRRVHGPATREALVRLLHERLGQRLLVVASNREPYTHVLGPEGVKTVRPAGGLTTALDPVMRVARGVWVASGQGEPDRQAADARGHVAVPPGSPAYLLRRVWVSKEEWEGYYLGAANEMLWPLCHIVHVRPVFRPTDWAMYRRVNERFARAILEEVEGREAIIWTQDYHLALVPRLLRKARPDLILGHFWHIPWPNPEAFRICPWKTEILEGLLGADVLGFHIRYHCDNFLRTIGQDLEAKIIEEHSAVQYRGHTTKVCPFPISIDFEGIQQDLQSPEVREEAEALERLLPRRPGVLAVGVDRLDYTKGIPERLQAIDLFLQQHPQYQGRFVYLGVAAPSRMDLPAYQELSGSLQAQVQTINARHATDTWQPILFHHRPVYHPNILAHLTRADIAIVSALHDGMNLVAKEFVAAQSPEQPGVLILSEFTGAARELTDALRVNPYHVEQFAEAIHHAARMPLAERRERIHRLQACVREHDIYRWVHQALAEMGRIHRHA
jgi:trehalose 6-phosphate synthase